MKPSGFIRLIPLKKRYSKIKLENRLKVADSFIYVIIYFIFAKF